MNISPRELFELIKNGEKVQLIDIRERYEFEEYNMGGTNIPLDDVLSKLNQIDFQYPVIFCCAEGLKSKSIVNSLKKKYPSAILHTLQGGVNQYFEEIENNQ